MNTQLKDRFLAGWEKYFPGAELPIAFFYTDDPDHGEPARPGLGSHCLICELSRVRQGRSLRFDEEAVRCGGGKRYLGFRQEIRPDFKYFLSCGIPGELEGERYVKSPEMVEELLKHHPPFQAPARYIVFKRWDGLNEADEPLVAIFFGLPDVLSGLFTLANYDEVDPHGVIAPFGSGCASIVDYPYHELARDQPRAVLGMFDVSARPCVPAGVLTLAAPWPKLIRMVDNMEESFLITASWDKLRKRIRKEGA